MAMRQRNKPTAAGSKKPLSNVICTVVMAKGQTWSPDDDPDDDADDEDEAAAVACSENKPSTMRSA